MKTGWVSDKDKWYYLDSDGSMKTGWLYDKGEWYYLDDDGSMATGWTLDDFDWQNNNQYYMRENGAMVTGWINIDENWYYFDSHGAMQKGILSDGGKQYYLDGNGGAMLTGWIDGYKKWYYAESDGSLRQGWFYYKNQWYYLGEDKVMAANTIIDGYYINRDGVWDKSYDNKVMVIINYEDYDISWEDSIKFSIINTSNNDIKYTSDFLMQEYQDGQWVTREKVYDEDKEENIVPAHTSKYVYEDLSGFRKKILSGKYRIGVKINGEYVYGEFQITNSDRTEGTVQIEVPDKKYYLNKVKEIPLTIVNNSDKKIQYDGSYSIEVYNGDDTITYEMKLNDNDPDNKKYELNPGETAEYSILLSNIDEKVTDRTYNIVKKIGDLKLYDYFELSNDNIAEIQLDKHSYADYDKKIELTVSNNSNEQLSFGKEYRIERRKNGSWKEAPLKNTNFSDEKILLKPHEKETEIIETSNIDRISDFGSYRITKEINGEKYYCYFTYGYEVVNDCINQ